MDSSFPELVVEGTPHRLPSVDHDENNEGAAVVRYSVHRAAWLLNLSVFDAVPPEQIHEDRSRAELVADTEKLELQ